MNKDNTAPDTEETDRVTERQCNIFSCRDCHPDKSKNQTKKAKTEIPNVSQKKKRVTKYCNSECRWCRRVLNKIEEDIWNTALQVEPIQMAVEVGLINDDQFWRMENQRIVGTTLTDYNLKKVRGDGNCMFRSLLVAEE
jgi:hypothetical protein